MSTKIISLEVILGVGENDIFVEDNTSSKAIVSEYEGIISLCMANGDGKHNYSLTKTFAKKLGEALLEKTK